MIWILASKDERSLQVKDWMHMHEFACQGATCTEEKRGLGIRRELVPPVFLLSVLTVPVVG
jgi:hypothetical protein